MAQVTFYTVNTYTTSFDIPEPLSRELHADPFLDLLVALHHVILLRYYWNDVMQMHVCL